MIMELVCDGNLNNIFYILKTILDIIMIIAPILAIVSLIMHIFNGTIDPDNKKNLTKFKNTIKALMIIFFIPLLINIVTLIIGEKTSLTNCWNNASKGSIKIKYYDKKDKSSNKTKVYTDPKDYYGKINTTSTFSNTPSNLDFTCTSKTVKAQFSCNTLKIVEKHLYDFDATNFEKVIDSYGGFDAYAKSIGGIFREYYGKKMPHETEVDFQRAAEYVLGWMYMYGWDYMNYGGQHTSCKGKDCFYEHGGFVGKYNRDPGVSYTGLDVGTDFDHIISGKNGGTGRMASECGDIEVFTYNKLGIKMNGTKLVKNVRLKDLKVGDSFNMWQSNGDGEHVVLVGEVYNNRVVFYDAGTYYPSNRNYKRTVYFPKKDSLEADKEALKKTFKYYDSYGIRRHYNYKKVESGSWEINKNKYIYHYTNGTTKKWTKSEYLAWNKLKEQNVKAMDPTAYTITHKNGKKVINYLGISHVYRCSDQTANKIAIENGTSPYAITVDTDNRRGSIFKNNNGVWEPIKKFKVNIGITWKEYGKPNSNPKIYSKDTLTPIGLFYTDGCNLKTWGEGQPYWVAFGVYPRDRDFNEDYFHTTKNKVSVGGKWTLGCISLKIEDAEWIYYNCGRGTPVLIW